MDSSNLLPSGLLYLNLTDTMASHTGGYRINPNWVSPAAGMYLYLSFFPMNATAVAAASRGKLHIHQFSDGEADREWHACAAGLGFIAERPAAHRAPSSVLQ